MLNLFTDPVRFFVSFKFNDHGLVLRECWFWETIHFVFIHNTKQRMILLAVRDPRFGPSLELRY